MKSDSSSLLKEYWFAELGCTSADLKSGKAISVPHGTLRGYKGIIAFRHGDACVVSSPADLVPVLHTSLERVSASIAFSTSYLESLLGSRVDRIIGPGWVGLIAETDFLPQHGPETRALTGEDIPLIQSFLASCPQQDVEVSSMEPDRHLMFGSFVNGALGAISNYEVLGGCVAHIGILTAPPFRRQGLAKKKRSALQLRRL